MHTYFNPVTDPGWAWIMADPKRLVLLAGAGLLLNVAGIWVIMSWFQPSRAAYGGVAVVFSVFYVILFFTLARTIGL